MTRNKCNVGSPLARLSTGYSSVGRASDCRHMQQSDGPWLDSGWPDLLLRVSLRLGGPPKNASTARGFEPLRAEPNGFLVHHLNHSVTLSCHKGQRPTRSWRCFRAFESSGDATGAVGYIAQWLERLTADQQVPGSNPGVPLRAGLRHGLINAKTFATKFGKANGHTGD